MYKLFRGLLSSIWIIATSFGQAGGQWLQPIERPWQSGISPPEIKAIAEFIPLREEQRAVLEALYADHATEYASIASEGRAYEQDISTAPVGESSTQEDYDQWKIERAKRIGEYASRLAALDEKWYEDAALILEEEQYEEWERYLRQIRLQKWQRLSSAVPGAKVDLNVVVERLELEGDDWARVGPILAEYNTVLDGLVDQMLTVAVDIERNQWRHMKTMAARNVAIAKMLKEKRQQGAAWDSAAVAEYYVKASKPYDTALQRARRRELAPQVAIRQTNINFAEQLVEVLPEELHTAFRGTIDKAKYPDIFRDSAFDGYAKRLLDWPKLRPDQARAIQEKQAEVHEKHRGQRERLAQLEEEIFQIIWATPSRLEAFQKLRDRSNEILDEMAADMESAGKHIFALLDAEQQSTAPKPRAYSRIARQDAGK